MILRAWPFIATGLGLLYHNGHYMYRISFLALADPAVKSLLVTIFVKWTCANSRSAFADNLAPPGLFSITSSRLHFNLVTNLRF